MLLLWMPSLNVLCIKFVRLCIKFNFFIYTLHCLSEEVNIILFSSILLLQQPCEVGSAEEVCLAQGPWVSFHGRSGDSKLGLPDGSPGRYCTALAF